MELYVVYGISDCPACLRAQALLMAKNKEYVYVNGDFSKTYRDSVKEEFRWATFPIIIKVTPESEELIGGYDDLRSALKKESGVPT
jgi:glutaredoxin